MFDINLFNNKVYKDKQLNIDIKQIMFMNLFGSNLRINLELKSSRNVELKSRINIRFYRVNINMNRDLI